MTEYEKRVIAMLPDDHANGPNWECLDCGFDKEESRGKAKPGVCPLCFLDNGSRGRIVTRSA